MTSSRKETVESCLRRTDGGPEAHLLGKADPDPKMGAWAPGSGGDPRSSGAGGPQGLEGRCPGIQK